MSKIITMIAVLSFLLPMAGHTRGFSGHMSSSHGSIHFVRPYINRHGIYHQSHLSGNPGSGRHCKNNFCV